MFSGSFDKSQKNLRFSEVINTHENTMKLTVCKVFLQCAMCLHDSVATESFWLQLQQISLFACAKDWQQQRLAGSYTSAKNMVQVHQYPSCTRLLESLCERIWRGPSAICFGKRCKGLQVPLFTDVEWCGSWGWSYDVLQKLAKRFWNTNQNCTHRKPCEARNANPQPSTRLGHLR